MTKDSIASIYGSKLSPKKIKKDKADKKKRKAEAAKSLPYGIQASSFHDFINNKMSAMNKERRNAAGDNNSSERITRESIASRLGYAGDDLKPKTRIITNTINTAGYTTNRDRIIAICVALEFNPADTNTALYLYGMQELTGKNERDKIIYAGLCAGDSFDVLNLRLKMTGLPPLSIEETKHPDKQDIAETPQFIVLDDKIQCGTFVGDNSLAGLYDPSSYGFREVMQLKDSAGNIYDLTDDEGGMYNATKNRKFIFSKSFPDNSEVLSFPGFATYFSYTTNRLCQKREDTFNILNDTRNYIIRYDVSIKNVGINVYAETFNYDDPEQGLYYQADVSEGKLLFTVTHNSQFLLHHLGGSFYDNFYRSRPEFNPIEIYNSEKEIIAGPEPTRKVFHEIKSKIYVLLNDIASGKIKVRDAYYAFGEDYGMLITDHYGIQKQFDWKFDENTGENVPKKWECTVPINNEAFTVSIDMLTEAYNFGIDSLEDLYLVVTKFGSVNKMYEKSLLLHFRYLTKDLL